MTPEEIENKLAALAGDWHRPPDPEVASQRRRDTLRGDFQLDPASRPPEELSPAAVLVPLITREEGVAVMLTQRNEQLSRHAGQIAFPGGRIDDDDRDPIHAALRETHEEVGLPEHHISVIGRLDDYATGTGFVIAPVVGFIDPPYPMAPDPREVAEVFEVPLAFFLDKSNHKRDSREWNGVRRHFYAMPYNDRYIWGATAAMLVNLYEVLSDS